MRGYRYIFTAYLLGFLGAYGHAYHHVGTPKWSPPERVFGALVVATFWPLYLTTVLQEQPHDR